MNITKAAFGTVLAAAVNYGGTVISSETIKFFAWTFAKGAKMAEELDYIPMPDAVVALIKKTWATELKGADGKPLYTATE
jgi:hypothetical protein